MSVYLVIGLPFTDRNVTPEWALSLRNLVLPMNSTYAFAPVRGFPIDEARNLLAQTAIDNGAKYLLMLDDDTAPPQSTVTRLLSILDSDSMAMVAGGIYFSREKAPQPIVFKKEGGGPTWDWTYGDIFECSSIGTGCMMIKTELFTKLEKPWFKTDIENNMTDDIYFCRKVKNAGYKIMADGGVVCIHWAPNEWTEKKDPDTGVVSRTLGKAYCMSQNDPPVKRFRENVRNLPVETQLEFAVKGAS